MKKIVADIINIGDELLIGQIVNTNASWMAEQLNLIGVPVRQISTIADTAYAITEAIDSSITKADIILITGGLGPTKDDVTKKTLADYFQCGMRKDEQVFEMLARFFEKRGRLFNEANQSQALLPEVCTTLPNYFGTAPGMLFEHKGKLIFSMPGVPLEMQELMKSEVLPRIQSAFALPPVTHRTFHTEGIPESELMKIIEPWEDALPPSVKLAYLPSAGQVRLRITSLNEDGNAQLLFNDLEDSLHAYIPGEIFGKDATSLEQVIVSILMQRNESVTFAESCTGGFIAHKITSVPGASAVFKGSVVAYDYDIKSSLLDVGEDTLVQFGAVSEQVVIQMANSARKLMNSTYAVAVSGIAGPGGGTPDKPVGTVWIAWATPEQTFAQRFMFGNHRMGNIQRTALTALNVLRKTILGIPHKNNFWNISK